MKQILLTWNSGNPLIDEFGWFESEKEVKEFIELNDICVIDAIEIINSRDIEV